METRYSRNRIYISDDEQEAIKDCPILLCGSGLGSVIAECALRLGFENFTIIDGDQVEESNLNRQNYTKDDISVKKTTAIKNRLLSINPKATIRVYSSYITTENVEDFIVGHKIAINALDFDSDVPLVFDELCQKHNVPVLHPFNLGWGGLVAVIMLDGLALDILAKPDQSFNEVNMVEYASSYMKFWRNPQEWIDEVIAKYRQEKRRLSPPQLSVASWMVASMSSHILFNIATKKEVKKFPEFYFSTLMNSN
jgi:molybdopterin/thiamine biosynthesis adenylyltransferase